MPYNKGQLPNIKTILLNLVDELNRFLLILWVVFLLISLLTHNFVCDFIPFLIIALVVFRLLSKNKNARYQENQLYLKIKKKLGKPFINIKRNFKDRHFWVYRKCHKCHTILKLPLPNKRGINHAKCPNCGKRITLFTLRKVKVEVIKKNK